MTPLEDQARRLVAESQREELLTVKEFADLFGRNLSSLYRALRLGRYPEATKIAGQWYVRVPHRDVIAARNRQPAA